MNDIKRFPASAYRPVEVDLSRLNALSGLDLPCQVRTFEYFDSGAIPCLNKMPSPLMSSMTLPLFACDQDDPQLKDVYSSFSQDLARMEAMQEGSKKRLRDAKQKDGKT